MIPPSKNWINFLRKYGPLPKNGNLFDEHITNALRVAKVNPIELETPLVSEIAKGILSDKCCSILIAGTAGDGKTYHARKLWVKLGGCIAEWQKSEKIKELIIDGQKKIIFVKDLSELNEDEGKQILYGLEKSVHETGSSTSYVIACNHGQILDRLYSFKSSTNQLTNLSSDVQRAFFEPGYEISRLIVINLAGITKKHSFRSVIKAIVEHDGWKNCDNCHLNKDKLKCPIEYNRRLLIETDDSSLFIERLENLIELSRLNGIHLPVRDQLLLVTNMLLGHPNANDKLMSCKDIPSIQKENTSYKASIYRNIFGANLGTRRAMTKMVFRTLKSFGIGNETTNMIDGLLVYGHHDDKLRTDFNNLVGTDQEYGATYSYLKEQEQYLEGDETAREEEIVTSFIQLLIDQRRRLFFTLPENNDGKYHYWDLSAYQHAGDYLSLKSSIEQGNKVPVKIYNRIVRGLNRAMTGLLINNTDTIFIASSGGFSQSKISVLCNKELPARARGINIGMKLCLNKMTQRPCIAIELDAGSNSPVKFDLTPTRFEFICRIADGVLPSSFSNECYEDLLAFKVRLLRKCENKRHSLPNNIDNSLLNENNEIQLAFIEVSEDGSGFLKSITIGDC